MISALQKCFWKQQGGEILTQKDGGRSKVHRMLLVGKLQQIRMHRRILRYFFPILVNWEQNAHTKEIASDQSQQYFVRILNSIFLM